MTDTTFPAFSISPVPLPGPGVQPPEQFRGIYGMPMFVNIPTHDLEASTDFWVNGLGFFEFFAAPGTVVHLRRWAFQDVLLVPAGETVPAESAMQVSFSCVPGQLDAVAAACRELSPEAVTGPYDTPWTTRDLSVLTPERVRVIFSAKRQVEADSAEARDLAAVGIVSPDQTEEGDNGSDG